MSSIGPPFQGGGPYTFYPIVFINTSLHDHHLHHHQVSSQEVFIKDSSLSSLIPRPTFMVDMAFDPSSIPEDQVQDILDWIINKSQEETVQQHEVFFPHLLNEDQLKVVVHTLRSLGHEFDVSIHGDTSFSTVFTLKG